MAACSSTKHVPQGRLLLDKVKINVTDPHKDVEQAQLFNYLRQNANHRVLGGLKLQLAFYNMSGKDSTNWFNRWIQRVGTPVDSPLRTNNLKLKTKNLKLKT